jgi:cell division protein FtsB
MKERESSSLRIQAEAQLKDLQAREAALNARITALETDRGQEEALRDQYQVGKEGEAVVTIVDKPASSSPMYQSEHRSWWQRIFWWW